MGASRPGEQPNPDRASTGPSGAEPVAQDDSRTRLATPGKPTYACLSPRTTAEPTLCAYRLTSMGASRPGEQPNPDRASTGLPRLSLSPRTTAEQDLPPPANPRMRACRLGRHEPTLCAYRLTSMGASRPGEQPNPDRASTGLPRLSLSPRTTAGQDLPPPANPRMRACRPGRQLNPRCASTDSRSWGLVVQDDLR
jgi:hypothetical protein